MDSGATGCLGEKRGGLTMIFSRYPLDGLKMAIEIISGFSHEKWTDFPWQSVNVYQRATCLQ